MPEDPFQQMLDEIAKLLKFAEDNASKSLEGPVDPQIEKDLERLEGTMVLFKELCKQQIIEAGSTPENALKKFQEHPEFYTPHEQKLLKRCLELGFNAVILNTGLAYAKAKAGKSKQREVGKNTKKSVQKRRKKFKQVGGDENWKRL